MSKNNGHHAPLQTPEEMASYDGETGGLALRPKINVGPADRRGVRLVMTQLGGAQTPNRFDTDDGFQREKWRGRVIGRLGLPDTAGMHQWLDDEVIRQADAADAADEEQEQPPRRFTIGELITEFPNQHEPIIDGLLRRREVGNIISVTKVGKSWLIYCLALCIICGRLWFNRFQCNRGRILLIDNELHGGTIAYRIPHVAKAMGLELRDYCDGLDVLPLRSKNYDLKRILAHLEKTVAPGQYDAILLDAWYRALPDDVPENGNREVMQLYNWIDKTAQALNCGWINVHHSSKGSQSEKSVTDVGSGAGSQSRAADCHIILRPHEESGAVVMESALRSFPPNEPLPLRWEFPLWVPADDLDPEALKGRKTRHEEKTQQADKDGIKKLADALLAAKAPQTIKQLRPEVGMGTDRCERLLAIMKRDGQVTVETVTKRGNECHIYDLVRDAD